MKLMTKNVVAGFALSFVLAFVFVPQIFAHEGESEKTSPETMTTSGASTEKTRKSNSTTETEKSSDDSTVKKEDNPRNEQRKEVAREKLGEKKKAVCENRQSAVNKVIDNVEERSKNHFDRITAIYEQTTKFYVSKGLSVSNYDELVAKVETAKAAALAAKETLTSTSQFSCDSDGPKADIQAFRNKRLDKVEAFGVYRDSVKALVVAVRDAAKASEETN